MTHQEYNTLMRLVEKKIELALAEFAERSDNAINALEEEVDELQTVLRAHICEDE